MWCFVRFFLGVWLIAVFLVGLLQVAGGWAPTVVVLWLVA